MKNIAIFTMCLMASLFLVMPASADSMLAIPGGIGGMTSYGGEYTGPIGATIGGTPITGGITCLDINAVTYVPNSGFDVYVGKLSPVDLSQARFRSVDSALFKYEEAAWLLGQMATNSSQTGQIQFAVWRTFAPGASSHESDANIKLENDWMAAAAAAVKSGNLDYSSVRIYTPTNSTNQEFMSGSASAVPEPASLFLIGSGLLGLGGLKRKYRGR